MTKVNDLTRVINPNNDDVMVVYDSSNVAKKITNHDFVNGIKDELKEVLKREFGYSVRVLEKCPACGQWGAVMCECPKCGHPIDPKG